MSHTNDHSGLGRSLIARHGAFLEEAIIAHHVAADGSQKKKAAQQLREAEAALMSGNEVNMLLAIHRAIRALE